MTRGDSPGGIELKPVHEMLSRMRWDPSFGEGDFVIGYYDRVLDEIVRVPLSTLRFEPGDSRAIGLVSEDGETVTLPLHRIREIYRDGVLIWHREPFEPGATRSRRS